MENYYLATDSYGRYYIQHGVEWKNHKYIRRLKDGVKTIYFYTIDELRSYLRKSEKSQKEKSEDLLKKNPVYSRPISRTRNVTGVAQPIHRQSVSGVGRISSNEQKVINEKPKVQKSASIKDIVKEPKRRVYKKPDGTYMIFEKHKDYEVSRKANDDGATTFGHLDSYKKYRKAVRDLNDLKATRKKLLQNNSEDSERVKAVNESIHRQELAIESAKDAFNRTRTLDEIPDYILTRGYDEIEKFINKRG